LWLFYTYTFYSPKYFTNLLNDSTTFLFILNNFIITFSYFILNLLFLFNFYNFTGFDNFGNILINLIFDKGIIKPKLTFSFYYLFLTYDFY